MTDDSPKAKKHGHKHKYTVTVTADSAEEAISVAAEALPKGAEISASEATPTGDNMGWAVTLSFTGGERRTNDPAG
ncbi:hypothetical protein [Govanella unica]|uniref:Uncharacterized protein n=1 Tax=Govanella unica TaxID=2975056 RepID=A0A9X3U002_9PROT|nr:hypothetical protein [Govania unica]MDA5195111.1 hypothetical protein [Govania unica]